MTRSGPPALAIRLMNETMTDPAVIGDMVEEHAKGRTSWWFWKQAIVAMTPSPLNAIRWAVAIPCAYEAARLVSRNLSSMGWEAGSFFAAPVAPACLILVAAWIAPSRKLMVAKTLLAIVGIPFLGLIGYSAYRSMQGGPGSAPLTAMAAVAASTLIGAVAGYAVAYYFFRAPVDHRPPMDHRPLTMD